ncbi:PAS domain-containing protein [Hyphococcus sp.]|uniref:PAS domain-containing protein n=1 Tax=Hyphococcus sp. TaxID=2038636 RepID=UPI003D0D5187
MDEINKNDLLKQGDVRGISIDRMPLAMVVTNPNLEDNPIVYVNRAFERLTGYASDAAVGRNCRFLQGPETDRRTIEALSNAIKDKREIEVDLLNYRADGETFMNHLLISPILDDKGDVSYFLGVQRRVTTKPDIVSADNQLREVQHRVKNHLQMVVSMIRMQAEQTPENARGQFSTLANRVETLQLLYQEMTDAGVGSVRATKIQLGAYITRIVSAIGFLGGKEGVRINVDSDSFETSVEFAARLGLIASEVFTNALQHGFAGRESGLVEVRISQLSGGVIRLRVTDDGVGMPAGASWPNGNSLGGRIVKTLIEGIGGKLSVDSGAATGTTITIDVPHQGETERGAN